MKFLLVACLLLGAALGAVEEPSSNTRALETTTDDALVAVDFTGMGESGRSLLKRKRGGRRSKKAKKSRKPKRKSKKSKKSKKRSKKWRKSKKPKRAKKSKAKRKSSKKKQRGTKPKKSSKPSAQPKPPPSQAKQKTEPAQPSPVINIEAAVQGSNPPAAPAPQPKGSSEVFQARSTFFDGVGKTGSGCGIPPEYLRDERGRPLPFVALNTMKNTDTKDPQYPVPANFRGPFDNGKNCGRWLEIKVKENCLGGQNNAHNFEVCSSNNFGYSSNDFSSASNPTVIYGYVADSCADKNWWCRRDTYHLDISTNYLKSEGGLGGGRDWNGRKVEWRFIDSHPAGWLQREPKFTFMKDSFWDRSNGAWIAVLIHNVDNGIGKVEQEVNGGWQQVHTLNFLGLVYEMKYPGEYPANGIRALSIRVYDKSNKMYGTWRVEFECDGRCAGPTDAKVYRKE